MYYIVYLSSASKLFTEDELKEIVDISVKNNTRLGITGMMLYNEGNFIQVLEGEEEIVKNRYSIIERDSRHFGMLVITDGHVENRTFPSWSMGFKIIPALVFSQFDQLKNPKERLSNDDSHPAIALLKSFSIL